VTSCSRWQPHAIILVQKGKRARCACICLSSVNTTRAPYEEKKTGNETSTQQHHTTTPHPSARGCCVHVFDATRRRFTLVAPPSHVSTAQGAPEALCASTCGRSSLARGRLTPPAPLRTPVEAAAVAVRGTCCSECSWCGDVGCADGVRPRFLARTRPRCLACFCCHHRESPRDHTHDITTSHPHKRRHSSVRHTNV